ncbi:VOC family protein [Actinomadura harenae]|uniref:Glyoxalase n=1 Tax=Actinomadura harenae TaxID=2483351 RepID=A0A3M2LW26_9ACTN|nr:VOC family protein [Actinomadura harenae]RMI40753.1 glyoxalase [Actinomadura harenae]
MDLKLELVPIPVSDPDRSIAFYEKCGFTLDHDVNPGGGFRIVQMTPPGSACSIGFGAGWVETPPGAIQNLHLVVKDIEEVREELVGRGVEISEISHMGAPGKPSVSYAYFEDPDGNGWALQQMAG